jgi:gamma-glutamyltranspeptidase/glutathione hydrolase
VIVAAGLLPSPEARAQQRSLLEYPSIHSPEVDLDGMVVSQNEAASAVGARVLAEGGNAIDAAVAVGFALAVTLPRAGNIGGQRETRHRHRLPQRGAARGRARDVRRCGGPRTA